MKESTPKAKSQSQRQRFVETAKELSTDENEEAFDAALKRIATAPVKVTSK